MAASLRGNREATDRVMIRDNSLAISLGSIAKKLNCHPSSVTLRLQTLNIPPGNTRHPFMEEVFDTLPVEFQEQVADILESSRSNPNDPPLPIREYVRKLLVEDVRSRQISVAPVASLPPDTQPSDATGATDTDA